MALIGTLTSGISALKTFSKGLDVIGNNIANVNTTAYKSSSASFADTFSNTLRASATGTSAMQVGTGVQLAGITANYTQGSVSSTGNATDLAISGNGYFVVRNAADGQLFATRAGNFRIDEQGYLVTSNGYRVQGATGGTASLPPATIGNIRLKTSAEIAAEWATNNAVEIHDTEIARDAADGAATALNALVTANAGAATAADVLTSIQTARDAAVTDTATASAALALDPTNQSLQDALILAQ
ncbi:MAG TPA: flagellar hook-basal body complex protein, partial [Opitutus sp.]|nr:flagellar hook-basal body complex protein [Opitutus sp.]